MTSMALFWKSVAIFLEAFVFLLQISIINQLEIFLEHYYYTAGTPRSGKKNSNSK